MLDYRRANPGRRGAREYRCHRNRFLWPVRSGLTADDFIVEEDGKRQDITHFSHSNDLAASVGIVLDTSGSMEGKISTAIRAVDRFIRDIHPEDEIFLMTFDDKPRVRQNFTSDREKLSEALHKTRLGSGTALYDGLIAGIDKLKKAKRNKKAVLLISDGVDTTSEHDFEVALLATRQSEALVYALGISSEALDPRSVSIDSSWRSARPNDSNPSTGYWRRTLSFAWAGAAVNPTPVSTDSSAER